MQIHPITGTIGAEITGLDPCRPIGKPDRKALQKALHDHLVLVFRAAHLDLDAQLRLTEVFGRPVPLPYITPMKDQPLAVRVLKEAGDRSGVFGGDWHSDMSFVAEPPAGSLLNAREVPAAGGDTLFANQVAAWHALSPALRDLLDGREAIHVGKPYGVRWAPPEHAQSKGAIEMVRGDPKADEERRHPAVLTHPETGRRSLYLNPIYVTRLSGMTEEESRPVLDILRQHATRPEFSMRLRWRAGDLAIWDNYATLHFAVNDYAGHRREMWRTTFAGPPIADWRGAH